MRLGIIGSSGGSSFQEMAKIVATSSLAPEYCVVADRPCGLLEKAANLGAPAYLTAESDNQRFSRWAAERFDQHGGVDLVFLFFKRLITADVFERFPTINFHSSLLPAYPGIGSVEQAFEEQVMEFGSTVHFVDASVDGGPIIAQAAVSLSTGYTLDDLYRMTFVQNVYLGLTCLEMWHAQTCQVDRAVPQSKPVPATLVNRPLQTAAFIQGIKELQQRMNVEAVPC